MKKKLILTLTIMLMVLGLTACSGTEIVEETFIETEEIGLVYHTGASYLESPEYKEILDVMEASNAQFFYIDHNYGWSEYTVYQTNMEKYNEVAANIQDATNTSKILSRGLNGFVNLTDKNIQVDCNTWFKGMIANSAGVSMICGGGEGKEETLYMYFKDNEIKLSSEGIDIKKLGIMHYDTDENGVEYYTYFFIAEGEVTVEAINSDPYNVFHEAGETKPYIIKGWGDVDTYYGEIAIDRIFLEK